MNYKYKNVELKTENKINVFFEGKRLFSKFNIEILDCQKCYLYNCVDKRKSSLIKEGYKDNYVISIDSIESVYVKNSSLVIEEKFKNDYNVFVVSCFDLPLLKEVEFTLNEIIKLNQEVNKIKKIIPEFVDDCIDKYDSDYDEYVNYCDKKKRLWKILTDNKNIYLYGDVDKVNKDMCDYVEKKIEYYLIDKNKIKNIDLYEKIIKDNRGGPYDRHTSYLLVADIVFDDGEKITVFKDLYRYGSNEKEKFKFIDKQLLELVINKEIESNEKEINNQIMIMEAFADSIVAENKGNINMISASEKFMKNFEVSSKVAGDYLLEAKMKYDTLYKNTGSENKNKYIPKCPTCGSPNIEKLGMVGKMVSTELFGLASNSIGKTFKCKNCGYNW